MVEDNCRTTITIQNQVKIWTLSTASMELVKSGLKMQLSFETEDENWANCERIVELLKALGTGREG